MALQIQSPYSGEPPRELIPAMKRGFAGCCPACGEGRMFGRFLKVNDACAACGEELHHQRADDLPPYVVITIVAHIVATGILLAETYFTWPVWAHMSVWPALTLILGFLLMQPVKGAVVGLQWAHRMHGFGKDEFARRCDGGWPAEQAGDGAR
ncbi:DUF983 domain-containing protein [Camelimonas abortus]|uniref:DUF983 domain-containing protein n=1 Tax=Camelimonas abortus TaxID=1017184 RepID=A0ABV7LE02_9HYPH